ncbi:acyltransferase [Nocardiopsis sp. CNT-189]|uniref:acyltransferase family protein n=1 Tax=Nocardiopsis oceanisediminis TaxID=2816862 RepID=UPI003B2AAC98
MTPPTAFPERDLFLDALRLLVIVLVVAQHWSLPVLSFSAASGTLSMGSVLNAEGGFAVTWIVQVMPLIFFVGGAVNVLSRRASAAKGTTASEWLAKRLRRLAWPVIPLAAAWIPAAYLLAAAGVPEQPLRVGTEAAGIVLWFLAVYVLVVVATPVLARAEDRFGWAVPAALLAGAAAVDTARFATGADALGYANVAFVWLGLHQLGFRYSAGAIGRRGAAAMAAGGFGAAVALAAFGPYSPNMTGVFAVEASNAGPPTLVLAGLGVGQIGLAVLLRDRITGWVAHPAPARVLHWIGPRLMTVYLWHMAPLSLVAGVLVLGLGMHTPAPLSGAWAVWCLVGAALALPLLCTVVGWAVRFEEPPRALRGDPGTARILGAAALTGGGLLVLTTGGLGTGPLPLLGALAVCAGMLATLPAVRLPRPAPVG